MARVLIVDDEPDILLMLRVNVEASGHEPVLAADGETALERAAAEEFDLMLLDVMMPVMDGWQVLDRLSHRDLAPRVVVVSAKSSERDVARALEAGALDYVTKPFDPRSLAATIDAVLALDPSSYDEYRARRLSRA